MVSFPPATLESAASSGRLRDAGSDLLVSCYELGHQPLSLAAPLALLRRAGFAPTAVDTAVEPLSNEAIAAARFVAVAVPMHTALRLGTRIAERVRTINPAAHLCFFGLYASLNADYLLNRAADSVISGEYEAPLLALVEALDRGEAPEAVALVGTTTRPAPPALAPAPEALRLVPPARDGLPGLRSYAGLER
ncbi:MAG TPA: hypothetical protein VFU81_18420, partial [Thermomicrobiales bacterium]|nr:hypothetical protein [Thermomicrobiales bacterium]